MMKVYELARKTIRSLYQDGLATTFVKIKNHKKMIKTNNINTIDIPEAEKYYMDVLFINGCYLPHPSRYRVSHQREQILAGNMTSSQIFYKDIKLELVNQYRMFIFYRCPYTEDVGAFINLAKKYNKKVYFDVDDLVIDTKYTDTISYVANMPRQDKLIYDNGVKLMGITLGMCDGAITTTEALANELKQYVPEVYINRNVVSERMVELSEKVLADKKELEKNEIKKKAIEKVILGYFSGSITHNADFQMILPAIIKIMTKYSFVKLSIVGELDLPQELKKFKKRIIINKFVNWEKLPELIGSVDINLVPLEQSVFNAAKSENKWTEASLVKVVTVASKVGALERMIKHGETGILCENNEEWFTQLEQMILNPERRKVIAEMAYRYVLENCTTIQTGCRFAQWLQSRFTPNLVFVLPTQQISGGSHVVLKHCTILMKNGIDVTIFNEGYEKEKYLKKDDIMIPVVNKNYIGILGSIDKAVATLWSTVNFIVTYPNIKKRLYLVQGYETDFVQVGQWFRFVINQTYNICVETKYITISLWCKDWLKQKYNKNAEYVPNGIDLMNFTYKKRNYASKIRVLIEGNLDNENKNVDESFKIVERLDKQKFEIWYMCSQGRAKEEYRVDRFLECVPYEKVPKVYQECHILLKSSKLESFSYPPLEMMATGGIAVVAPNGGNVEYLVDRKNCLFYEPGNIQDAVEKINEILDNENLRNELIRNGLRTAEQRDWRLLTKQILKLYINY